MRRGPDSRGGKGRLRLPLARLALALTGAALLIGAVLAGPATRPLAAQDADDPVATDRAALMALYEATGGSNWTVNRNWGTDAPLGAWHGVSVNTEGRVTGLRLERNNLTGTLPEALGNLANLEDLDLSSNQLHGPVFPPCWADLFNLRELRLRSNQLSGPIPPELGNLPQLRWLSLAANQLRGPIPPELGNLANLRTLGLSDNQLSGPIPPELGNLINLGELHLIRTRVRGPIPPELGNLTQLRRLFLAYNELSGPIPATVGNLVNLRELWLYDNQLSGPIPAALGNLPKVEGFSLANNQLSGPIPSELGNLPNLRTLNLTNNQLSGPIPAALANLPSVSSLSLYANRLSGPIPPELGNLSRLQKLLLSGNRLSGPIPATLGRTSLVQLWLDNNRLSGPIPPELGNLGGLRDLLLHNNRLSGPVPEELSDLPYLKTISLRGNPGLAGCLPRALHGRLSSWDFGFPGQSLPFCLLRDLRLTSTVLNPPFATTTDAYTAAVAGSVEEIVVRATLHDANDTVTIRKDARTYANGAAVPLARGTNLITVEVAPPSHQPTQIVTVMVTRARTDPIALPLRAGGDLVVIPAGVAATAVDLFGGTDVASVWRYSRHTRTWDRSYLPRLDRGNFAIAGGDVLWVVAPAARTLVVHGTPPPPDPGPITLDLREGGDIVAVPAGRPTTAADLFGGTDVASVWKYNPATRRWDLPYLPARDRGGFAIAPGDALWVVSARAQTIPDTGDLPAQDPDPAVEADRAALMALYDATDGPYWTVSTNWGSEAPLGAWHGVTTDGDGRVIRLDLYLNRLSGPIPPELGTLANLQRLELPSNQLSGPLPPELGHLANLEILDLGNNQLQGPIPPALSDLANLRRLSLWWNRLSGPIPPALGRLTNLRSLNLSTNQLQGPIPPELGDLANLERLDLYLNGLSGAIPPELGDLTNLRSIRLAQNAFIGCVPHGLRHLAAQGLVPGFPAHEAPFPRLPLCLLRDLRLAGAMLEPSFRDGTDSYTAAVGRSVAETAVTATLHDARDRLTIHKGGEIYANGAAVPLDRGPNVITIEMIPADGTPPLIVTVTVTRGWGP